MYHPGFFKRLLVALYDGFLLIAVLIVSSAVLMAIFTAIAPDSLFIDPDKFEQKKIATLTAMGKTMGSIIVTANCMILSFFYYAWFWIHGGQTVGMRAWNLYLVKEDGKFIDWKIAAIRYASAIVSWVCLGMGFAWVLLTARRSAWHDTWSCLLYTSPSPRDS